MSEYWESRFKNEGAMWNFEPSDSAIAAMELFKSNNVSKILIPGIGYGRNARIFCNNGFEVTGIEISESAITLAKEHGLPCKIHYGSVTSMPYDNEIYDGIFCYSVIHLLNRPERHKFLTSCYNQLKNNGLMVFVVASKQNSLYGTGKCVGTDRYEVTKGLKVFFYDSESVSHEFGRFGLMEERDIAEPVKFMEKQEPVRLKLLICKKM